MSNIGFKALHLLNGTLESGLLGAYIGLDYLRMTQNAYTESGTNIRVDAANMNLLQMPVGLYWIRKYEQKNGCTISPELSVGYVFNLGDRYADLQYFQNGEATPDHALSQNLGRGTAIFSGGIKADFSSKLTFYIRDNCELRNNDNTCMFELKYSF